MPDMWLTVAGWLWVLYLALLAATASVVFTT